MLSDTAIVSAKPEAKDRKLHDEHGLFLLLKPNGARWWRWDYRFDGRRKSLSFGVYPIVSLAKARARRDEARRQLDDGYDPSRLRQQQKRDKRGISFQTIAEEWLTKRRHALDASTTHKLQRIGEMYLFPKLGRVPINRIEPPDILAVLRPIEAKRRHETAHRAKQMAGQILRYAVATGRATRDSTADLKDALAPVKTTHHPAIVDPKEIGALLRVIESGGGNVVVNAALRLAPLVFLRPGELRQAEWAEIDLRAALWRIPAERMKMREAHIVPLSRQAVAILTTLHASTGSGRLVFPALRSPRRPISDNTLNAALRRLGYDQETMTAHGFRTIATTHLNELGFPPDVIERQLAHRERNAVRAAYNRAQHLPARTAMMQAWANFLDTLRADAGRE